MTHFSSITYFGSVDLHNLWYLDKEGDAQDGVTDELAHNLLGALGIEEILVRKVDVHTFGGYY